MNVLIMGCGRSGSALATRLEAEGDEVSVVDLDGRARDRLPREFRGRFVAGDGMHRAVLEAAGVARAEAVVTLSHSDSLNVIVARIARDKYHVPRVVGRLNDAQHAPLCSDLGLPTVTAVRMTVDRIHRMLHHSRLEPTSTFGGGESLLVRSPVPDYLHGRHLSEFNVEGEIQVVEVTRHGHSAIPTRTTTAQRGDLVSFAVTSRSLGRLRSFLGGTWS